MSISSPRLELDPACHNQGLEKNGLSPLYGHKFLSEVNLLVSQTFGDQEIALIGSTHTDVHLNSPPGLIQLLRNNVQLVPYHSEENKDLFWDVKVGNWRDYGLHTSPFLLRRETHGEYTHGWDLFILEEEVEWFMNEFGFYIWKKGG